MEERPRLLNNQPRLKLRKILKISVKDLILCKNDFAFINSLRTAHVFPVVSSLPPNDETRAEKNRML